VPFGLPRAIAKGGSERTVYVPAAVLGAVWDYVRFERAEAVERAQAAGTYERFEDALLVEDPTRPRVRMGDHWVEVARLDPAERARLVVAGPQLELHPDDIAAELAACQPSLDSPDPKLDSGDADKHAGPPG
jgi:hypothetical protein